MQFMTTMHVATANVDEFATDMKYVCSWAVCRSWGYQTGEKLTLKCAHHDEITMVTTDEV
jgi:hypothetical protein